MDIATLNYQRIAKNFIFGEISQRVTGKNANKSKFKASGQTGVRKNKGKFAYRMSGFKRTKCTKSLIRPTICLKLLVLSLILYKCLHFFKIFAEFERI
jgi:hypothetical protein